MKLKAKRNGIKATIDMTPMLDVVFQLIIFFLVSTTFAVLPGIKLKLPDSKTSENTSNLGITITADNENKLYFNDKAVTMEELSKELSAFDTKDVSKNEFPVVIEADENVRNKTIVSLFDVIRENGFAAVNLRTKKD